MNYQIVGEDEFVPRRAMATVEFEQFFLARISDMDASSLFKFAPQSGVRETVQRIAANRTQFSQGGAQLARDFHGRHVGQSSAGAFFFFELHVADESVRLYSMLKYDYREVLAPSRANSSRQLRKIVEAFVQDKRALQKSCLIRVRDGVAEEEISARDRNGKSPDITDFFSAFLSVQRSRDDTELNHQVYQAVTEVLKSHQEHLPDSDLSQALNVVRERLRTASVISNATALDALLVAAGRPADPQISESLEQALVRSMKRRKVSGLEFAPDENVLKRSVRKKLATKEGVHLDYPQYLEGSRVKKEALPSGGLKITITTDRLEVDKVVAETARALR
ncbi:nucleoid-associated protein [Stenotrophomonas sp.]|uniref:nucleoid-associated protein n=1 Tax=Stenotrophomonas sp. TaxID=69392 RepID=UPI00289BAFF8|nr:nucleoid-associated protein [Stenotrophomonas sp.]